MTKSQTHLINRAIVLALNARHELSQAADGTTTSRPTADQLNNTLTRLSTIVRTLEAV